MRNHNDITTSESAARALKTLFLSELALSPVIAAIAYVASVGANWGVFKYVPALLWLLIFVQCLFSFRWRGLWFLLGAPLAILALVTFLAAAPPVPQRSLDLHRNTSGGPSIRPAP